MSFDSDEAVEEELLLYVQNTSELHPRAVAISNNLARKFKTKKYDHAKAPAAWQYLVDAGAKSYAKEFDTGEEQYKKYFTAPIRRAVAKELADQWLAEAKLGNF